MFVRIHTYAYMCMYAKVYVGIGICIVIVIGIHISICVLSNGLISSPFLGKTFFLSKNHEGDTLNFLNEQVSKIGAQMLARPFWAYANI